MFGVNKRFIPNSLRAIMLSSTALVTALFESGFEASYKF